MKTKTCIFAILLAGGLTSSHAQDTWTQKADFGGTARFAAVGFSIGSKGYIGTGSLTKDFWEYDSDTNAWTQKADFAGTARTEAVGFSIGSKGYIGTGYDGSYKNDFWEYDPATNAWTQKAHFAGTARPGAVGFSIGSKGYIGKGYDPSVKKDFWEYDPSTNSWTRKADFGGTAGPYAVGFFIGSKGYIGTGSLTKDFWEYDPDTNAWTQKATFGGTARAYAVGLSIGSKGYIGTGYDGSYKNDFWEYDPANNAWTLKTDFAGTARIQAVGFSTGSKGYIGTGSATDGIKKDFWEYTPGGIANLNLLNAASVKRGFGIDLPLTGSSGVEDRSGGPNGKYTVVLTFDQNITSVGSASSTCGAMLSIVIDSSDAHKVNINLTNVAHGCNGSTITITANAISDDQGNTLESASVGIGLLLGDVNGDRVVDATDNQEAQSHKGQKADSTNFRSDVNASGHVEQSDIHLIRQEQGTSLP